jgi:hypothetical protein
MAGDHPVASQSPGRSEGKAPTLTLPRRKRQGRGAPFPYARQVKKAREVLYISRERGSLGEGTPPENPMRIK